MTEISLDAHLMKGTHLTRGVGKAVVHKGYADDKNHSGWHAGEFEGSFICMPVYMRCVAARQSPGGWMLFGRRYVAEKHATPIVR